MDKSLVSKATSPDAQPTPGYMFNEIARITQASAEACKQLIDFLLKRLKKDNVHVKAKTLRVMRHCCQQGHATFRRDLQHYVSAIKECLSAPAPLLSAPHPVRLQPAAPRPPSPPTTLRPRSRTCPLAKASRRRTARATPMPSTRPPRHRRLRAPETPARAALVRRPAAHFDVSPCLQATAAPPTRSTATTSTRPSGTRRRM